MFRPFELFIGLRYLRAKQRNNFISFISITSILGIALGVMALIVVLSVMNGFEKELRERILGMAAHASITSDEAALENWQQLLNIAKEHENVVAAAPFIDGQGMVLADGNVSGVMLKGVLPEYEENISEVASKMVAGSLDDLKSGQFGVVLGKDLANSIGVTVGNKITLIIPQANVTAVGLMPRMKRFIVKGVFQVGMYEYDSAMVLLHMHDTAKLLRLPANKANGVLLRVDDIFTASKISREVALSAVEVSKQESYLISDWTKRHSNLFKAIKMEKRVMFVILALIIAVAAFNIVSTMVMVVTEKSSEIAILRTIGATPTAIMTIFLIQGIVIGTIGTMLGVASGVAIAVNIETIIPFIEQLLGFKILAADVYYISKVPSDLHQIDVIYISVISLVLTILAAIYPSWRASRTQPAEALRYE